MHMYAHPDVVRYLLSQQARIDFSPVNWHIMELARLKERETDGLLTNVFSGLKRNCETGEWEPIDVACPGLPEPYRSRIKARERREAEREVLLFGPDGRVMVRR